MVRIFQVAFPLIALALVTSIFVLSKSSKLRSTLIDIPPGIAELAIGQKITNPHFSGVTKSGDAFSITAASALPDAPSPRRIDLEFPSTTLDFKDGRKMRSNAGAGFLDLVTSQATLRNGVTLETSNGYTADAQSVTLNFETGNVTSLGPINATGPVGNIQAGGMTLTQNLHKNPEGGKTRLLFTNGVKLVYKPAVN